MQFLSARQAISDAYNTKLATQWEFEPECGDVPLRRYCPVCHRGPLRYIGQRELVGHDGKPVKRKGTVVVKHTWRCPGCKADSTRPLVRKPVGVPKRSSNAGCRDNDWRICSALEAGKVQSVVEALPDAERAWALYVYTDPANVAPHESVVMDWLVDQFDDDAACDISDLGSARHALHLMLLLIHDARARETNGQPIYSDSALARHVFGGCSYRQNFKAERPWGRFRTFVETQLEALNARALGPVAQLVDEMKALNSGAA